MNVLNAQKGITREDMVHYSQKNSDDFTFGHKMQVVYLTNQTDRSVHLHALF